MNKIMRIKTTIIALLIVGSAYAQGDCLSSATAINTCGFFFAGNNQAFGDCPGSICGCVGGSTNPSNLDDDCSTTYPGGNCGSDFAGSIENSMFWKFRPTEDCEYQLCITPENCCCNQGASSPYMQVWIGQIDTTTGLITEYYVNDNNNALVTNGNTICYNFPVLQSSGDVVVMLDGNAGTECDINLDINQISCSDTCPIIELSIIQLPPLPHPKKYKQVRIPTNMWNILGAEVDSNDIQPGDMYILDYNEPNKDRFIEKKIKR